MSDVSNELKSKKVLICGGRDFNDVPKFQMAIIDIENRLGPFDHWISGGARGADTIAEAFAKAWGKIFTKYPADWKKYGRSAGYVRNKQMLEEGKPDLVVAFPGGLGTAMMIKLAREANVPVEEVV